MINVTPIPAFRDNYFWLISKQGYAIIVDPGDATPVIDYLEANKLTLVGILITHHHSDHIGGIRQLKSRYNATVWGPQNDPVKDLDNTCQQGDKVSIPQLDINFQVLSVAGHTLGHIAYFLPKSHQNPNSLFCGDTLFSAGCGRLFEGTPGQMLGSIKKLMALPEETLIYPAHEYTLDNLKFARALEPNNQALIDYQNKVESLRKQQLPSLPTQLAQELNINPFMRFQEKSIIDKAKSLNKTSNKLSETEVFATIRHYKDNF